MKTHLKIKRKEDFLNAEFKNGINAIGLQRTIIGNYKEIVDNFDFDENILQIDIEELKKLHLSKDGIAARDQIIEDFLMLERLDGEPILNIIKNYERDTDNDVFPTDVYSFHVDRSPYPTPTYLCTYFGEPSEIISNNETISKHQIPKYKRVILELANKNSISFEDMAEAYFYDLHYLVERNAFPIKLGIGEMWKLEVDHPERTELPCIHRAPEEHGQKRLLLIC